MDGSLMSHWANRPLPLTPLFSLSVPPLPLFGSEAGRKNGGKRESRPAFGFALSSVSDFGCVTLICLLALIHNREMNRDGILPRRQE